ncbi:MAG: hypothetical protein K1000chlam1_00942 [Candidatus Anoxychlamydiales bacterium]|nr:hypothetical protein [Candidatus Anoxychlamydiales bacterium]
MKNYIKITFFFALSFIVVYASFLAAEKYPKKTMAQKNQYYTKAHKNTIVRVELEVLDDTTKDYYDVIDIEFNKKPINLLKAGASGRRARTYFQLEPGKYLLKWKVSKSGYGWPRYTTHKKIITLKKSDKFVHILVVGEKADVTTS